MSRYFSGRRLRDARIAARLKAEQVALHIGRSVYSVHAYEHGRAVPSVPVLAQLADELAVPIDALFADVVVSTDAA